METTTG